MRCRYDMPQPRLMFHATHAAARCHALRREVLDDATARFYAKRWFELVAATILMP